jgi:hypothetical protein
LQATAAWRRAAPWVQRDAEQGIRGGGRLTYEAQRLALQAERELLAQGRNALPAA